MKDVKMRWVLLLFLLKVMFMFGTKGELEAQKVISSHRATKGSDSVVPCTFNGPPVQTIIWYFQKKEILRYDGEIRSVDPRYSLIRDKTRDGIASLVISNITIPDAGTYTCSLLYSQGKRESDVTVDIQATPEITVTNNIVVRNKESVLGCSVTGFYPFSVAITWLRDGDLLYSIKVGNPETNPDGTYNINTTATILPTEENQYQTFSCKVQYEFHDAFQKDFQLIYGVQPSLHVNYQPFQLNKEQTLICQVWGFYPELIAVSWFLNGTRVETSSTQRINSSAVKSLYKFTPTVQLWGTEISCEVEHGTLPSPLVEKVLVEEADFKIKYRKITWISPVLTLMLAVAVIYYCIWKKSAQAEMASTRFSLNDIEGCELNICNTVKTKYDIYEDLINKLEMNRYKISKLTLKNVLEIGPESIKKIEYNILKDAPWYFLRNLMSLNPAARNTCMKDYNCDSKISLESGCENTSQNISMCDLIHPLDVLYVLLHCSEPCLHQEIISKMFLCQFAVPLLLPVSEGPGGTFMLWAMRDIVKRWKDPSSTHNEKFQEELLVNIPMSVCSFMRLGKCIFSKSDIINGVLSREDHVHNFFLHRDMEAGYIPRKISDGLVEITWYFPGSKEKSNVLQNPFAMTNMRGDLECGKQQFRFLCQISTAVFIFTENISEREYNILTNSEITNPNCSIIIVLVSDSTSEELKNYKDLLEQKRYKIKEVRRNYNKAKLIKYLKRQIGTIINKNEDSMSLKKISCIASHFGFPADEHSDEHKKLLKFAKGLTKNIKTILQRKGDAMGMAGNSEINISETDMEMCHKITPGYNSLQSQHDFSVDEKVNFLCLTQTKKWVFLTCIKLYFQSIVLESRQTLCEENMQNCDCSNQMDQYMLPNLFGERHFNKTEDPVSELNRHIQSDNCEQVCYLCLLTILRPFLGTQSNPASERSKFCCCIWKSIDINDFVTNSSEETFSKLPGIGADLLLDGFPLKIINDDSSIHQDWVSNILSELDIKTGGNCRMRVISVLGVQRKGKSTLLNTMFGLQFHVARGRCTRGAFMTLINVKENFKKELKCDFILVIDTDFFYRSELASLESSQESNDLATLVVGVSDITIINVGMENRDEMNINLQSVVHALLRVKQMGKKLTCLFVHQDVDDMYTYEDNNQELFWDPLDKISKTVGKKLKSQVTQFSDIIESNHRKLSHNIPSLLFGAPSMNSVNSVYSECVRELKEYLISNMRDMDRQPQSITEFKLNIFGTQ